LREKASSRPSHVLLTSFSRPFVHDDRWPAAYDDLDVHVLDSGGLEVPGTLERYGDFDIAVWRPAQAWPTDAKSVDVHWSVDIDGFVVDEYGLQHDCWALNGRAVVEIVDRPLPILASPTFEAEYGVVHSQELEDLVCCDGAYPEIRWGDVHHCVPEGRKVWIDEGTCESLAEIGRLTIRASVGLERDPTPALAACDDMPYVCEVVHHIRWDPEQCTPWPATETPDIASRACSCGGEPRVSALGWLVLVFTILHRRSRPSEGGA
jgi:hypothetical protein